MVQQHIPKFLQSDDIPEDTPQLREPVKVLREWNEKKRRFENVARPENYRAPAVKDNMDNKSVQSLEHNKQVDSFICSILFQHFRLT